MTFINAQKVERYFRLLILTNHQLSEKHSYRSFSHRNESIFLSIIKQNEFLCNYYFVTSVFLELTEETRFLTVAAGVKSEIGIHNFPKAILICFIKYVGEGGLKLISTIKILKSLPPDASAHFSLIPNQILILIVIQLQILQQPTNSPQKEK